MVIRNAMEDFHVEHLSDDQMRELNPIIRNAVYTALQALHDAARSEHARQFLGFHAAMIPSYWEPPELLDGYLSDEAHQAAALLAELGGQFPITNPPRRRRTTRPAVSSTDQTRTDEPLTVTEFEAIGDTTFELRGGDLSIGGRDVGHGPLARALLRWLAGLPRG
jgi:hypothetical protein